MSSPTREDIYQALFALVTPLIAVDDATRAASPNHLQLPASAPTTAEQPFRTISREVIECQRIEPGNQPVLMMYEMDEHFDDSGPGLTPYGFRVVFIFGVTSAKGTPGQTLLNPLIELAHDAIDRPDNEEDVNTLGGLVEWARVKGTAGKDHGNNSTSPDHRQASYYLPVEIKLSPP
jgi:hypothetical protein